MLCSGCVKLRADAFVRGLGQQADNNDHQQPHQEGGQQLIDAEDAAQGLDQVLPEEDHNAPRRHAGDGASKGGAFPIQGADHQGAEARAKARPGKGDDAENGTVGVFCNENAQNGNGDDGEPGCQHTLLLAELEAEGLLQQVLGHAGGCRQQLGIRRGHGAGQNARQDETGHQCRENAALGQKLCDADDDGLRIGALQRGNGPNAGQSLAHDADKYGQGHGNGDPGRGHPAAQLQLLLVADGHEPQQDMGHSEVAQAPGQGGDNGEDAVGGGGIGADGVGLGQGQVAGQGSGIFQNGPHAPGLDGGIDQHKEDGNGHDDALDQIRNGGCQEAPSCGVAHNDHGGHQHGRHIVDAEEAGKQLAAGGEAGGRIGNEENDDDHSGQGGEDALFVMEPPGEELGDGVALSDLGIAPQAAGGEEPVEIGPQRQADGRPAHVSRAGQVGQSRQAHEQVAGHIRCLGTHCGHQWSQGASAQIEVGGGGIFLGIVCADPEHTQQVYKNRHGDANGRGHNAHPFSFLSVLTFG